MKRVDSSYLVFNILKNIYIYIARAVALNQVVTLAPRCASGVNFSWHHSRHYYEIPEASSSVCAGFEQTLHKVSKFSVVV